MPERIPAIGQIVLYQLRPMDEIFFEHPAGVQAARRGDVLPAIVVHTDGVELGLQLLPAWDERCHYMRAPQGTGPGTWSWPPNS